jgi:hypothetical protein
VKFCKGAVAVEIQLSDPADCYNDFLKFLLAHNLGLITVGVEIVYDDSVGGGTPAPEQGAARFGGLP